MPDNAKLRRIGTGQQFGFVSITPTPNRSDGMDDIPRFQIATGRDDCIADWAATDLPALLVDLQPSFGVNLVE